MGMIWLLVRCLPTPGSQRKGVQTFDFHVGPAWNSQQAYLCPTLHACLNDLSECFKLGAIDFRASTGQASVWTARSGSMSLRLLRCDTPMTPAQSGCRILSGHDYPLP